MRAQYAEQEANEYLEKQQKQKWNNQGGLKELVQIEKCRQSILTANETAHTSNLECSVTNPNCARRESVTNTQRPHGLGEKVSQMHMVGA